MCIAHTCGGQPKKNSMLYPPQSSARPANGPEKLAWNERGLNQEPRSPVYFTSSIAFYMYIKKI